jgi:Tol biopolymer transport system component
MKKLILVAILTSTILSCKHNKNSHDAKSGATKIVDKIHYDKEKHLANIKQLTFGGDNAEAYFSTDDKSVVFQAKNPAWDAECDRIYVMNVDKPLEKNEIPKLISTGTGRTTCSFYINDNKNIIYSSTHETSQACPPVPKKEDYDGKYIWPVYESFDIYLADLDGKIIKKLTNEKGYDAEPTVSPQGDKIVFTSTRSGDLELWTMDVNGENLHQVTHELGYDGGAFFSPDGTKLIFRSSRPKTPEAIKEYKDLLAQGLVMPTHMELYVCNVDGSDLQKITNLGSANWAPYFHPNGKKVLFSTNHHKEKHDGFNLFMINVDGTGLEQITYDNVFDAFPMFSYDGKKLIFSSNRNNHGTHDTNLFIADWVE